MWVWSRHQGESRFYCEPQGELRAAAFAEPEVDSRVRRLSIADGARNIMAWRFWVSKFKRKYTAAAGVAELSFALRIGAFLDHCSSFRKAPYLLSQFIQIGLPIL
jgi:hypothetical protein